MLSAMLYHTSKLTSTGALITISLLPSSASDIIADLEHNTRKSHTLLIIHQRPFIKSTPLLRRTIRVPLLSRHFPSLKILVRFIRIFARIWAIARFRRIGLRGHF
jgi:hypothetical protein